MIKPNRKTLRLSRHDYSQPGYYFITICTKNRQHNFGKITDGVMELLTIGKIVEQCWLEIPQHFSDVRLDEHIIMPNHLHGILEIIGDVDVGDANLRPLRIDRTKMLIPKVIHGFKSSATRRLGDSNIETSFKWQRSYYDHIIRAEQSLFNIREYITDNSINWQNDFENIQYLSNLSDKEREVKNKEHYNNLFNNKN